MSHSSPGAAAERKRATPRENVLRYRRLWRVLCFLRMHPLDYDSGTVLVSPTPCWNCGRPTWN